VAIGEVLAAVLSFPAVLADPKLAFTCAFSKAALFISFAGAINVEVSWAHEVKSVIVAHVNAIPSVTSGVHNENLSFCTSDVTSFISVSHSFIQTEESLSAVISYPKLVVTGTCSQSVVPWFAYGWRKRSCLVFTSHVKGSWTSSIILNAAPLLMDGVHIYNVS
jgi:hypothetical protein